MKGESDLRFMNSLKITLWMLPIAIAAAGGLIGSGVWLAGASPYFALGASGVTWVALMALTIVLLYRRLLEQLAKRSYELGTLVSREAGNSYRQVEALMNLRAELAGQKALPPMRSWAISPDFAALLVERLKQKCPENILECGSGVSSLVTGYVLKSQQRGHLISLEHDEDYARRSRERIYAHGLGEYVTVLHAPLVRYEIGTQQWDWYDIRTIKGNEEFDFLIVDGPPDTEGMMSRYPVLHILGERIKNGAVLLLDDTDRLGEKKCIELWARDMPDLKYEFILTEKGAAVIWV